MSHDFSQAVRQALEHLAAEFDGIRTGRANPSLVADIQVEAYGVKTPLQQLAAINVPEPRLLVVQPWDPTTIKDIEKALTQSSLGITPVVDGKLIRLPFPSMTEERRKDLVKLVKEKAEGAKVRIRTAREEVLKDFKRQAADGGVSEDEAERQRQVVQTQVGDAHKEIEALTAAKEQEVLTV